MTWEVLVPLIVRYGVPAAFEMWKVMKVGPPSEEQWNRLLTLTQKTLAEYIHEAKTK